MHKLSVAFVVAALPLYALTSKVSAQDVALLLFDGKTGQDFAGCLNCTRTDPAAICNRFGDYGSKYSDESIWNRFGQYGSRFEDNSPWNKFGEGLRIVDQEGNYYGRFSMSPFDQSRVPLAVSILEAYEAMEDLDALRDLLCE